VDGFESDERLACAACGSLIEPADRTYPFGAEGVICFPCAIQRGGTYDDGNDRWTRNPDVSDVAEPER
jgi:hypothetical protein